MTVWDALRGQPQVAEVLRSAVRDAERVLAGGSSDNSMTHAWLFTGPPGSGRSTAARAFAAGLVCSAGGCGTCHDCHLVKNDEHSDVHVLVPEKLSISVDEARALTKRAALNASGGRWQVILVEDADRLNEISGNALLKAIEEPGPRTVWLLCAPTPEDMLVTIRSRVRHVLLATPKPEDIIAALTAEGVDEAMAGFAARVSQGHLGRARALARDEGTRMRRQEILRVPGVLRDPASSFVAAANILAAATEDASAIADRLDASEESALMKAYGESAEGVTPAKIRRIASTALKELKETQKSRRTRLVRDQLDRALLDLMAFYRDVLAVQFRSAEIGTGGPEIPLVNEELRPAIETLASRSLPEETLGRISAIEEARVMLASAVAPTLALEAMTIRLAKPSIGQLHSA